MDFRRKLTEMTTCSGVAPVTVAPMGIALKKKRLQGDPKKKKLGKDTLKEVDISAEADKLLERLAAGDEFSVSPRALSRIKLQEPVRKPNILPRPGGLGHSLKNIGSKVGKFASSFFRLPPHPTAPEEEQLPIAQSAVDRINLKPGSNRAHGLRNPVRPPARQGTISLDGKLVPSHVHSKRFPRVSYPTPEVSPDKRHTEPEISEPRLGKVTGKRKATLRKIKAPLNKKKYAGFKGVEPDPSKALGKRLADMTHNMGSMDWIGGLPDPARA